ncbi:MAG: acyl-CoA dehydrogenase family protein [Nitrosomonas sp.]|nr:MAG: acyl-CoA dehydrogenase family protein [Nitrosomonas sp.]
MHFLEELERITIDVVAKNAANIDKFGIFPQPATDALRNAGLLGLLSDRNVGGSGLGIDATAAAVERIARECASTAMVLCMHYCATAVIKQFGSPEVRKQLAQGNHLATLAFSEIGSRSHFWSPVSTATRDGDSVYLNASKSWVTAAHHATLYM